MIDESIAQQSKYEKVIGKISQWIAYASFITIFLMLVGYVFDGVYRFISGKSIFGLTDIVELSLVITIFLGIAYVGTIKGHINVTLASERYKGCLKSVVDALATFLGIIYFALLTWQLGARGWKQVIDPALTTNSLQWPIGPFLLIMSFGCFLLLLVLFGDLAHELTRAFAKRAVKS